MLSQTKARERINQYHKKASQALDRLKPLAQTVATRAISLAQSMKSLSNELVSTSESFRKSNTRP